MREAAESHVVEVEQGSRGRDRTCEQGKVPNQDEETCMVWVGLAVKSELREFRGGYV